jgi:hypothetical protein
MNQVYDPINNKKIKMDDWINYSRNNIVFIGLTDTPIGFTKKYFIDSNHNELNYILECYYTTIKHHLSFKQTVKQNPLFSLDNYSIEKFGCISLKDVEHILNSDEQIFRFAKKDSIFGVPKLYVDNNQAINSKVKKKYFYR